MLQETEEDVYIGDLSDFAKLGHEIRSPVNSILNLAKLLQRSPLNPAQLEYVERIEAYSRDILSVAELMLHPSRGERFSLCKLLNDVKLTADLELLGTGVSFLLENQLESDIFFGNAQALKQIILNLTGNSVKFTESGFIRLSVRAGNIYDGSLKLNFEVFDTGLGMDLNIDAFEPFVKGDSLKSGSGLGLFIAKKLVSDLNGEIFYERNAYGGTSVSFFVRLGVMEDYKLSDKVKGKRVLVVDDSETDAFILKSLMEAEDIITDISTDPKTVSEKILKNQYDLLLMDINLTSADGRAVSYGLRKSGISIPIISVTAYSSKDIDLKNTGINDIIEKPIEPNTLYEKLGKYLSRN